MVCHKIGFMLQKLKFLSFLEKGKKIIIPKIIILLFYEECYSTFCPCLLTLGVFICKPISVVN